MFTSPQVILFSDHLLRAVESYKRLGFNETFRVPATGEPVHVDLELDGYRIGIASGASTRGDTAPVQSPRASVTGFSSHPDLAGLMMQLGLFPSEATRPASAT